MYRHKAGPRVLDRIAPGVQPATFTRFSVTPVAVTLGGLVSGLDLSQPLDDETFAQLDQAYQEYKALLFRDQHLTGRQHIDFMMRWGPLTDDQLTPAPDKDPYDCLIEFTRDGSTVGLENGWHVDGTFRLQPPAGTLLRAVEVPLIGGDTMFADMAAAYDNLEPDVQRQIETLTATHATMNAPAEVVAIDTATWATSMAWVNRVRWWSSGKTNTWVLPVSFRVNQTCLLSGVAAMLGQNGLSCFTRPTICLVTVSITTVSGLKDEHT